MPKVVDHQERRATLVRAAIDLVSSGGVGAASVRAISAATGWSAGAVRYYIPTSAALEELLLEHVSANVQRRVAVEVRAGRAGKLAPVELAARMLEQILPLDDERAVEHRIWVALYVVDPSRAVENAWAWMGQRMFHRQLVQLLSGACEVTDRPGPLDETAERRAGFLHAYADGLALRIASGTEPLETARTELRSFLAGLTTL